MNSQQTPWWKGARGEWYVVIQLALFVLVLLGPANAPGWLPWTAPFTWIGTLAGGALMLCGAALAFAGIFRLGANLTPLPYPKDDSTLVESGPYALVRHPIYSGLILGAFGWALWVHGWLTLDYALFLFVFFDLKSRREEGWLGEKFPGYAAYRQRVRKLLPWIY
jgi:protein-S-isoprenylcysteine O-methyltransferase Ste14